MRFSAHIQVYEQPVLSGKTGDIPWETQCHILTPDGEPVYRLTRMRIHKYYTTVYKVNYVAHKVIQTPWLFGPASLWNKTLIYPCENFRCRIGCPCKMCRDNLNSCEDLEDHMTFHRAPHSMCKFCQELQELIPYYHWKIVFEKRYYSGVVPQFEKFYEIMGSCSLFKHKCVERLPNKKEKTFSCDKCEKQFLSIADLKRHEVSVHFQMKFQCPNCGLQLTRKDSLETHIGNVHGTDLIREFKCDICLKSFNKKSNFVRHEKNAKTNCSICAETFCTLKDCQQHMITHQLKEIKCCFCHKSFSSKGGLKKHVAGRVEFKCDLCDKVLCNSFDMKMHRFNDHDARSCDICQKGPYCLKNYKYHMYSEHQELVEIQ